MRRRFAFLATTLATLAVTAGPVLASSGHMT